jgi:hypothetical protein
MATNESLPGNPLQSRADTVKIIDLIVKATVILAAFLYGCGFLVISIHQYSYGIAEMSLLRPKVLAAGIWFLCFAAVPFVLVIEGRYIKSSSPDRERWLRERSTGFFFSAVSCFWIGMFLAATFDLRMEAEPTGPSSGTIVLVMALSAALVTADQWKRFPHWLAVLASLAFGGLLVFCGIRDLLYSHQQSPASIALWFIVSSFFASTEMQSRSWKLEIGNWKQSVTLCIGTVAGFSGLYYPHIKPSWGGGAPITAIIYFAKDSLILPSRSVSANILDETDNGFYVIGGNDKKATFIPRNEVTLVYYSDDASGPFVIKTK